MKRFLQFFALLILVSTASIIAQVNYPASFDLATGPYSFTNWANTNPAGTYPSNMIFHRYDKADGKLLDSAFINYALAYNATSGIKVNGLTANGIEFVNSSATQSVGMAVVALKTTNRTSINVSFTAALTAWNGTTPFAPRREWAIRLQYSTGNTSASGWTDVLSGGVPVEFSTVGLNAPSAEQVKSAVLPSACDNQAIVYVRFKFYDLVNPGGGGSRPQCRLDEINITSSSAIATPTKLAITSIVPSTVSSTSTFSASVQTQSAANSPANVSANTPFTLDVFSGTGVLLGNVTGTIPANSSTTTVTGLSYSKIENSVQIRAVSNGDPLTDGISAPFNVIQGATTIAINNLVNASNVNKAISPFTVNVNRPDGTIDSNYQGTITITKLSGLGNVLGTLSGTIVNGGVRFSTISFSDTGSYTLNISATNLTPVQRSIMIYPKINMTELFIPQYMKSATSATRVPTWALVRVNNLIPNQQYRFISGAVNSVLATGIGGGNNYHYDAVNGTYLYSFNRFLASTASPASNSFFTTGVNETSKTLWINLVPTTNTAFGAGNNVIWRVILTDNPINGYVADTLNTTNTTKAIDFGSLSTNATGIYDNQSGLAQKTFVMLYDNTAGTGNPLSTAIVQDDGTLSDTVTFAPYYKLLDNTVGAWATLIPSSSANGIRRMEQRDINGNLLRAWTDEDGVWAGVSTINQIGGLNAINFSTPQIRITNINPGQVFCVGKPVQITWVSRGVEKANLQYSYGSSTGRTYFSIDDEANGASGSMTWIPNDFKDSTTNASIRIVDAEHPTNLSEIIPVTFYIPPTMLLQPKSRNTCLGDTIYMVASAYGTGVTYQWYKDGKPLTNQNKPTIMIANTTPNESGLYHCSIGGTAPCSNISSDTAVLYVNRPLIVLRQPESKIAVKGSTIKLEVEANGNFVITYQWFKNGLIVEDDTRISGANSPTLIIRDLQPSDSVGLYSCVAKGPSNCGMIISDEVKVSILSIGITSNPKDIEICKGSDAILAASAKTTPNGVDIAYQWFKNGIAITDQGNVSGSTTSTLTIANADINDIAEYTVKATTIGNVIGSVSSTSSAARLSLNTPPSIIQQPVPNITACVGTSAKANAIIKGNNVTYKWVYVRGNPRPVGADTSSAIVSLGADTSEIVLNLNIKKLEDITQVSYDLDYKCIITSACGVDSSTIVNVVGMQNDTILKDLSTISDSKFGDTMKLEITARGAGLTYQWYKDGNPISGAINPAYIVADAKRAQNGSYYCIVKGMCNADTSNTAVHTVIGPASLEDNEHAWMLWSKPNPSDGNVTIQYYLPSASKVTVQIRDILGSSIMNIEPGMLEAGMHEYPVQMNNMPAGVYYYTLQTSDMSITKSMTIIK